MRTSTLPLGRPRYPGDNATKPGNDGDDNELSRNWKAGRQEYLILATLSLSSLMIGIDGAILAPALPVITNALHGTAISAWWAGSSFLLASSVCIPLTAALSDIFGRQELLIVSLILFTFGSLIACTSKDIVQLLAGRSVQGVGGGGITVVSNVIFTDIVPLRQRPKFTAPIIVFAAVGAILGPLVGGIFSTPTTWRWIFYLNFPFCAIGLVTIPWVVRLQMKHATSLRGKLLRIDWFGSALFIAGTTSSLAALTCGGVLDPWDSFQTIVPLVVGSAVVAGSITWARWGSADPFVRVQVLEDRTAAAAYLCSIIQGILLWGQIYSIPLYFEVAKGLSAVMSGVALLPITCSFFTASVVGGVTMSRIGQFRWAVWSGWFLAISGSGLLIILDENTRTITWVFIFLILGSGSGLLIVSLGVTVQATARSDDTACAAALYLFTRALGMCLGVALGGTVFQNALVSSLANAGLPVEIAKNAVGYVQVFGELPAGSEYKHTVIGAYVEAFHRLHEILTAISFVGGILCLLIDPHSLDKKLDSKHVLRPDKRNDSIS